MKISEEIRMRRKEYFAHATFSEKVKYLLDYYGLMTFGILLALGIIVFGILEITTAPEDILNGAFINVPQLGETYVTEQLQEDFMKAQEIDTSKYTVNFSDNLIISSSDLETTSTTHQVLMVQMSGGKVDFIVSSPDNLMTYAYDDILVDLTTVLTEEQIEKYKPYFLYVDAEIIRQRTNDQSQTLEDFADYVYPDPSKPEDMKDPIPVFIDFSQNERIQKMYSAKKLNVSFAIVVSGNYKDNAVKFLDFIMK